MWYEKKIEKNICYLWRFTVNKLKTTKDTKSISPSYNTWLWATDSFCPTADIYP